MINIHDLKSGDTVITNYGGAEKEGTIVQVDHFEKKVLVATEGDNEYWYDLDNLVPIHLTPETLLKLQFHKDEAGSTKGGGDLYVRGPFSVRFFEPGHEPLLQLHYRDETRSLNAPITLNELQNHYHAMTNFHLE
ncbi:hypothetical protein SAMN05660909_04745 [Chitinophaga terrae (ex Kim and Jung 2007)]|jgi:hypothetical protein|uniref:Uncharacterized protein n=1 Tax=Chitinophaga terrae (ex Kim and Jung 2007) TaxID=408074 RepID=A0A1H4FXB6_9BACT|nr:hypothetical protein [Chitinophaga terrae (ex Kim and Jung 2007)]MDQ0108171.1 hypothetical protein [Chitinophaga terrae (ex Kim and Jung 2007)]GEP92762.1 hypothetical protein CTE07_44070 [Chitinophaga terrae (ex Kim and Jung 2007)]SEB01747.1 hypothetical protein SAMN05660909_04745 [Chitinophaga terrae (ex Kim and Jung 2007)]